MNALQRFHLQHGQAYFNCTFKLHWMMHIAETAKHLHPSVYSCFQDEDFMQHVKILVHSCTHGSSRMRSIHQSLSKHLDYTNIYRSAHASNLTLPIFESDCSAQVSAGDALPAHNSWPREPVTAKKNELCDPVIKLSTSIQNPLRFIGTKHYNVLSNRVGFLTMGLTMFLTITMFFNLTIFCYFRYIVKPVF